jgi:hypothetical protein
MASCNANQGITCGGCAQTELTDGSCGEYTCALACTREGCDATLFDGCSPTGYFGRNPIPWTPHSSQQRGGGGRQDRATAGVRCDGRVFSSEFKTEIMSVVAKPTNRGGMPRLLITGSHFATRASVFGILRAQASSA